MNKEQKMETIELQIQELKNMLEEQSFLKKEVLTLDETATYMNLSKATLYRMTSDRTISFYKPYGKIYFKRSELDDWMLSNRHSSNKELHDNITDFISTRN